MGPQSQKSLYNGKHECSQPISSMTMWKLWPKGEQSRMSPSCGEHECLQIAQ